MAEEAKQDVEQGKVEGEKKLVRWLLRCKASITPRELGAIFNMLFIVLPEDQKQVLQMLPGIEFIEVPDQEKKSEDAKA